MEPRILFLTGLSKRSVLEALLDEGATVQAVVVPDSDRYRPHYQDVVSFCRDRATRVVITPHAALAQATADVDFDVLLSCGYPFVIPSDVFLRPRFAINVHPTLLPKHRGKYVIHVLLDRDDESGATAHLITDRLDAGPIVAQRRFTVSPFDTVQSLLRKSAEVEIDLVRSVLTMIRSDNLVAVPQEESAATTHVTKRTPDDSEIDPDKTLRELFYEIRAYDAVDYPAFFRIRGEKVYVRIFRKDKPSGESDMI